MSEPDTECIGLCWPCGCLYTQGHREGCYNNIPRNKPTEVIEVCADCGAGVIVPAEKAAYLTYAFQHRFGKTLCLECYYQWRWGKPAPKP